MMIGDYAVGRVLGRGMAFAGLSGPGRVPLAMAIVGLGLLRRGGKVAPGAALVALAGGLGWYGSRSALHDSR